MASIELSQFQQNLAVTGQNLTRLELQVNGLKDTIRPVGNALQLITDLADVTESVRKTSEKLETSVKLLGSVPKVGIIAKRLADILDTFGDAAGVLETKLKALESAAEPVNDVLDKVSTVLGRFDSVLDGSISLADSLII